MCIEEKCQISKCQVWSICFRSKVTMYFGRTGTFPKVLQLWYFCCKMTNWSFQDMLCKHRKEGNR
jgi:hypothetical protein